MRILPQSLPLILLALVSAHAHAQFPPPASPQTGEKVAVYTPGADTTAPELLPTSNISLLKTECKLEDKLAGSPTLSLVVGSDGLPYSIHFLRPTANDLDIFALKILAADRFKPGAHAGSPAAVALSIEIHLETCMIVTKQPNGEKTAALHLVTMPEQKLAAPEDAMAKAVLVTGPVYSTPAPQSNPATESTPETKSKIEKVGGAVTAPKLLVAHEINNIVSALRADIEGTLAASLIVDAQGMPQNIQIVRSLGHGLDEQAIISLRSYRYLPAMHDGKPVPVAINVEIRFRRT
jgi:protein TonB